MFPDISNLNMCFLLYWLAWQARPYIWILIITIIQHTTALDWNIVIACNIFTWHPLQIEQIPWLQSLPKWYWLDILITPNGQCRDWLKTFLTGRHMSMLNKEQTVICSEATNLLTLHPLSIMWCTNRHYLQIDI